MTSHRLLLCEGFPNQIQANLGRQRINASRFALARALVTISGARSSIDGLGFFWAALRSVSTVFGLLDGKLRPTPQFRYENASYRAVSSFHLAEAFSHWFAQTHLDIDLLSPLEEGVATVVPAGATVPFPKTVAGYRRPAKVGVKSRPDFVGIAGQHRHVLESKGRARFKPGGVPDSDKLTARNKALYQVCRIATVDGMVPLTRTACVFSFENGSTSGWITDPGPIDAINLELDLLRLVRRYYGAVLDPLFRSSARELGDDYFGVEFAPGWTFAIHGKVWNRLLKLQTRGETENFLDLLLDGPWRETSEEEGVSAGPDGLRLKGPPSFELPFRRKE